VDGRLVDALDDAASSRPLLDALLRGARVAGGAGALVGHLFAPESASGEAEAGEARAIGATHANAAIRYGDRFLLKVYRRLDDGPSPEVDAGLQLSRRAPGLVAPFVGAVEYHQGRGSGRTVAVLQGYVANQGTAWEHACAELDRFYERILASDAERGPPALPRDLLASLARQEPPAAMLETMGGYYAASRLLGSRTAEMHLGLAASDDPAFAPEAFSPFDRRSSYQSFRNLIGRVIRELRVRRAHLPAQTVSLAAQVVDREKAILERVAPMLHVSTGGMRVRIHGDYHLGQVLHASNDFVIIDFDGDARVTPAERRRKHSVLRDIAEMLRSLRHAAFYARAQGVVRSEDRERLLPWERLWSAWAGAGFLRGYLERAGAAAFLPGDDAGLAMWLDRSLLSRALHELDEWIVSLDGPIQVPLGDILAMLA
jgi:maltose alpha-D-glucosyltransferase/alpha-amylase